MYVIGGGDAASALSLIEARMSIKKEEESLRSKCNSITEVRV